MRARVAHAWRAGPRHVLRRALESVYLEWLVLECDLRREDPPTADPRLRFAELTAAEPELLAAPHLEAETVRLRLAAGHLCFAILLDDLPVATVWARTDSMWLPFLRRHVPLGPGEIYLYDSYTHPAHRRRGLTALRRAHTHTLLSERGYRRARAYVLARNRAGLAAARGAGYHVAERHRWLHLGPLGPGRGHETELRSG